MAKKAKMTKVEIIDKIIQTCEYAIAPVTIMLAICWLEAGVYMAAFLGMVISILTFVKLFIKK